MPPVLPLDVSEHHRLRPCGLGEPVALHAPLLPSPETDRKPAFKEPAMIRLSKYSMIRKLWAWSVILVFLCALPFVVWADKPPDSLFKRVTTTSQLVHRGECNVKSMNLAEVPCLIFYDEANDLVWVVVFDQKNGEHAVTYVILSKEDHEVVAWCRQDVCL